MVSNKLPSLLQGFFILIKHEEWQQELWSIAVQQLLNIVGQEMLKVVEQMALVTNV